MRWRGSAGRSMDAFISPVEYRSGFPDLGSDRLFVYMDRNYFWWFPIWIEDVDGPLDGGQRGGGAYEYGR